MAGFPEPKTSLAKEIRTGWLLFQVGSFGRSDSRQNVILQHAIDLRMRVRLVVGSRSDHNDDWQVGKDNNLVTAIATAQKCFMSFVTDFELFLPKQISVARSITVGRRIAC